jgi:hypothetical protein
VFHHWKPPTVARHAAPFVNARRRGKTQASSLAR